MRLDFSDYYKNDEFCEFVIKSLSPHPENVSHELTQKLVEISSQKVGQLVKNFNKKNYW